jgi:peroxiredoxin
MELFTLPYNFYVLRIKMSIYRTHFLYIPIFFLIFSLSACKGKKPEQENQIGKAAPAFTLKDLNGTPYSLENFRGKVVLLRFWATRCESCKVEMPKLENSYRRLLTSGLMVLAVNVEDPADKAAEFANELRLTYPILIDGNKDVTKMYQVYGVPTSFVIDRKGIIRERVFGDLTEDAIERMVSPLL